MKIKRTVSVLILFFAGSYGHAAPPIEGYIFYEPFESLASIEGNGGIYQGGEMLNVPPGFEGNSVKVNSGATLSFDIPQLNMTENPSRLIEEGTLMFWVAPEYDWFDLPSHAFISFKQSAHPAYPTWDFTVSDGWWESTGGRPYFYFIAQPLHARFLGGPSLELLWGNEWKFVAVSWRNIEGNLAGREMTIAVNGEVVAQRSDFSGNSPYNELFGGLGSSRVYIGSDHLGNRNAESRIDELTIYDRVLTANEIDQAYKAYLGENWSFHRYDERMEPELSQAYTPLRNKDGVIMENRMILDEVSSFTYVDIDSLISKLKSANINIYVPNVWHGKGTRYLPRAINVANGESYCIEGNYHQGCFEGDFEENYDNHYSGGDPFVELIQKAHAENIEVHAWFTVSLRQWQKYNEWKYDLPDGKTVYDVRISDFRDYIVNQMLDVVERYDIDGVNLDYIRSGFSCGSSDQVCKEEVRDAVKAIVEDFKLRAKGIKPNLIISADVGLVVDRGGDIELVPADINEPAPSQKLSRQGRNPVLWLQEDLIDVALDMDYNKQLKSIHIDAAQSFLANDKKPKVAKMLGNWENELDSNGNSIVVSRDAELVAKQVRYLQNKTPGIVAIYWYSSLSQEQIDALVAGPFNEPAVTSWPLGDVDKDSVLDSTDNCPIDPNPNQADQDNDGIGNVCDDIQSITFFSDGAYDGEVSSVDGINFSTYMGDNSTKLGDSSIFHQLKAITSFDIAALAGFHIRNASIRLIRGYSGGDTSSLGQAYLDLSLGGFNGNPVLEGADFSASASVGSVASLDTSASMNEPVSPLNPEAIAAMQDGLAQGTSVVQFRAEFSSPTDNDGEWDYEAYNNGRQATNSQKPQLIIEYTLPD